MKLVLGSIIRTLLAAAFGALVKKGLIDQQTAGAIPIAEIATGVVGIIGTFGWSLWQKAIAKWKFLQALSLDPKMNPDLAAWVVESHDDKPKTIPGAIAVLTGGGQ